MSTSFATTTVERLCYLFGLGANPKPIMLLGAGASLKSGIPLSADLVEMAARWAYCRDHGRHPEDPSVVRSDWLAWLHEKSWYRPETEAAENYSAVVEHLLQPRQDRKDFFLRAIKPGVPASLGYHRLLRLVDAGFIDTVLTTNFDPVFLNLCAEHKRPHHMEVVRTPADHTVLSTAPSYPQYVFLHGTIEHYTDQNLLDEVQRLDQKLVERLVPLLRDRPLVVVGYRGAEPSIMHHLLADQASETNQFRQGIFWCSLAKSIPDQIHPLLKDLQSVVGHNLQLIPISGFDELLEQVGEFCERQPGTPRSTVVAFGQTTPPRALPYDMQPLPGATLEELDWGRIQTVLPVYCREMKIQVPTRIHRSWLIERLCDEHLAVRDGDNVVPTVAGYLLFAQEPHRRIQGAATVIRLEGRNEPPLTGNLWSQLEALTALVDEVNRPFRLKGVVSEDVYPYPKLALKELIVNALVHRSYEGDQLVAFDIEPTFIRITNPGGLVDLVFARVREQLQEKIEQGARGVKGYRNPVLADLFYGAGAMDKKGSGLPDVQREVKRNGGQVTFGPIHDNSAFRAAIYRRPEQVDEETRTAAPVENRIKYSTNLIEVVAIPEEVFTARSDAQSGGEIWRRTKPDLPPPFVWKRGGELVTFSNPTLAANPLSQSIHAGSVKPERVADWQQHNNRQRDLVWLLNECFYRHLQRQCLVVDRQRKRAYFPRTESGPREIVYRASFRQAKRTVTKPFVSRKTERVLYWEHEAIWFGFELFGDTWALRILPGYVFTTDGEQMLLHHTRVGALATRKSARDYNLQVHNDLVFWTWVLSGGQDSFTLPTGAESPILLRGALSTCELTMPIAADADFRPEPPRWGDLELAEIEAEIAEAAEQELDREWQEQPRAH